MARNDVRIIIFIKHKNKDITYMYSCFYDNTKETVHYWNRKNGFAYMSRKYYAGP